MQHPIAKHLMILIVAAPLVVATAEAALFPLARCERTKLKASGSGARAMLTCHARAAGKGVAVDVDCLERARSRVHSAFAKAEAKGPCPISGEAVGVVAALDAAAAQAAALLVPVSGASLCARLKLKAAGRRLRRTLARQAKHALRPEREGLLTGLAKADSKYQTDWAKAEAGGGCSTTGDAAAIAADVDEAAANLVDEVRGTLKALAAGRPVGTAIRFDALGDPQYRDTAARHFNHASTWGETVWVNVEPQQGVFNLGPLDQVVGFAETHELSLKGITLVWHELLPAWMQALTDPGEFRDAMEHHITTLVGGYAGRIHIWDVVNEAVQGGGYRVTPFLQRLGPDYIADAFHMAHQADPTALLFYNDFGIEKPGANADFVYQMIVDLLAAGVPIHGVGFQVHDGVTSNWNLASESLVRQNLQRFVDLGLIVQLAEAESSLGFAVGNRRQELLAQRETYHSMARVCLAIPECTINFFGFTDGYFWPIFLNRDPLMFDANYAPKPAFFGVRDALVGY